MIRVTFTVLGRPAPAGSKRAIPVRRGGQNTGQTVVIDANKNALSWKQDVAAAAFKVAPAELLEGPLGMAATFYLQRPAGHYGSGRNSGKVKPSAPRFPTVAPDSTKLVRGVEDALAGVLYRNDAQIIEQQAEKRYGQPERAEIVVWTVDT